MSKFQQSLRRAFAVIVPVLTGIVLVAGAQSQPGVAPSIQPTSQLILTYDQLQAWWQQQQSADPFIQPVSLTPPGAPVPADLTPLFSTAISLTDYRLDTGDTVAITLLGHPELSQSSLTIHAGAQVDLPLIGPVALSGKNTEALSQELNERYAKYLRYPNATVTVIKGRPQTTHVLGAVAHPGLQSTARPEEGSPNLTLMSALHQSGGLAADADPEHVVVLNAQAGRWKTINLIDYLIKADTAADVALSSGDVVYVPRLLDNTPPEPERLKLLAGTPIGRSSHPVRVYGLVAKPDVYLLTPQEMTLQSALAKAGLQSEHADTRSIVIGRTAPDGRMSSIAIDSRRWDMALMPNDVVLVTRFNARRNVEHVFDMLSAVVRPFFFGRYVVDPAGSLITW